MPLGWYLAQGLIPLGPSESDDEEGPCELPNGRIVCGPHGLVVCGRCCTDYSFMDDILGEDDEDDLEQSDSFEESDDGDISDVASGDEARSNDCGHRDVGILDVDPEILDLLGPTPLKRGTGSVFPTRFSSPSPSITPLRLFSIRKQFGNMTRFTHRDDPGKLLILADGACLDNGRADAKAGWAFWHGRGVRTDDNLLVSRRLERRGPFGDAAPQTSNRAELRAVIAAIRFRHWPGEGFHTLVVATDSEYVAEGATNWVRNWIRDKWRTKTGEMRKNYDLWEALLGEVETQKEKGLEIMFWRIPREWNMVADAAAKEAAATGTVSDRFSQVLGFVS